MTRLIDADALLEELRKSCEWHAENSRELSLLQRDINIVGEQPTIDAVPVRHGRWLYTCVYGKVEWVCNQCEQDANTKTKYCPECGARMDAERKEE